MTYPKFSIVTPSFNQGQYLERTILSVINQGYPNLEYIIIDGGSKDNSIDIIKQYERHLTYWVSERDPGQSNALNKGFSKITGDIVGWIASDDWYEPGAFDLVAEHFGREPDSIIVGDCIRHYEPEGRQRALKPKKPSFETLLRYWRSGFCPPQPSVFFPSTLLNRVGVLNEQLTYAMDLDLWLRMAPIASFHYIPKTLSHYLVHSESKSGSGNGFLKFRKEWRSVCLHYLKDATPFEKLRFYIDYNYYKWKYPSRVAVE